MLTYNGVGLVEEISDPFGRTAQFVYDANRNLIQVTDMGGLATSLEYDSNSYLSALVNEKGVGPDNTLTLVVLEVGAYGLAPRKGA